MNSPNFSLRSILSIYVMILGLCLQLAAVAIGSDDDGLKDVESILGQSIDDSMHSTRIVSYDNFRYRQFLGTHQGDKDSDIDLKMVILPQIKLTGSDEAAQFTLQLYFNVDGDEFLGMRATPDTIQMPAFDPCEGMYIPPVGGAQDIWIPRSPFGIALDEALSLYPGLSLSQYHEIEAFPLAMRWDPDVPRPSSVPADSIPFWFIALKKYTIASIRTVGDTTMVSDVQVDMFAVDSTGLTWGATVKKAINRILTQ